MRQDERSALVYSTEHSVSRNENPVRLPKAGALSRPNQPLLVRLEKKGRGGKTVTVISGLGLQEKDTIALLKQLKSRLGTGGAFKDDTLEIQGDHRDALIEILAEMGLKPKKSGG